LKGTVVAVVELVDDELLDEDDDAVACRRAFTASLDAAWPFPPPPPLHAASATTIVATATLRTALN
jgi:hypothetical protein